MVTSHNPTLFLPSLLSHACTKIFPCSSAASAARGGAEEGRGGGGRRDAGFGSYFHHRSDLGRSQRRGGGEGDEEQYTRWNGRGTFPRWKLALCGSSTLILEVNGKLPTRVNLSCKVSTDASKVIPDVRSIIQVQNGHSTERGVRSFARFCK